MGHLFHGADHNPAEDAEVEEACAALGVIIAPREPEPPPVFEVFEDCWAAVDLFCRVLTQWRTGPGGVIGLDYRVVFDLMELYQVTPRREVLEDVQVMEAEAVRLINKRTG